MSDEPDLTDTAGHPGDEHPRRIGEYRVVGVLGQGGMGVVYEAEQQNPRRRVAIKVIREGRFLPEEGVRLFHREAQALALLKHPSIAQIYETGRTESGRHYFAMELVRGTPLNEYMTGNRITRTSAPDDVRRLLALFERVCDGVNYAHQRGVIHRDLKPSNMLVVDGNGARTGGSVSGPAIKILDFGIAKITDIDTQYVTRSEQVAGTIAYMSPEQARGNPDEIDVRSDVYSLGVILYELLTGRLPYDLTGAPVAVLSRILHQDPDSPSGVWRRIGRRMDPDLETVLLKALSKEPARRYQSAWALAEDLDRYRSSQPILARPPSALYQVKKLILRNKIPFVSAAAGIGMLAASAVLAMVSRYSARVAEATAVAEAARAEAVNDFLQRMLSSADPALGGAGRDVRVVDVLERAAREASVSFASAPEVEAEVRTAIGKTYTGLGLHGEAGPQLDRAIAIRRASGNRDIAASLEALGTLKLELGAHAEAQPLFEEALDIRRREFGERHIQTARSLNNLGALHIRAGRYREAAEQLDSALVTWRSLGGDHEEMSVALENRATIMFEQGDVAGSERWFRDALAMRRRLVGDRHLNVALGLNNLALVLTRLERFAEAESMYVGSLRMYREILGDEHASVARGLNNLGMFNYRQGNFDSAEVRLRAALAMNEKIFGSMHQEVAANLNNIGLVLRDRGDLTQAEALFRRSLLIEEKTRPNNPDIPATRTSLAAVLMRARRYAEAEALFRVARTELVAAFGENNAQVATTDSLLGECLLLTGRSAEAAPLLLRSYERLSAQFPVEHGRVQAAIRRVVRLYQTTGDSARATQFRALLTPTAR